MIQNFYNSVCGFRCLQKTALIILTVCSGFSVNSVIAQDGPAAMRIDVPASAAAAKPPAANRNLAVVKSESPSPNARRNSNGNPNQNLLSADYNFTFSNNAYTPLVGATQLIGGSNNSNPPGGQFNENFESAATNIGFSFQFDCLAYTQFRVTPSGYLTLGSGSSPVQHANDLASAPRYPIIAPWWDKQHLYDNGGAANGCAFNPLVGVHYLLTGTAPNRILKVEFNTQVTDVFNSYWWAGCGLTMNRYQVWLYEGTNNIEFRYGSLWASSGQQTAATIGIGNSTLNFLSVTPTGGTATVSSVVSDNNIAQHVALIPTGTTYTFNPCYLRRVGNGVQAPAAMAPGDILFSTTTVAVGNSGNFTPFTLDFPAGCANHNYTLTISGASATEYRWAANNTQTLAGSIAAGGTLTPGIIFSPTGTGVRAAFLTITDNTVGCSVIFTLNASGCTAPFVLQTPASICPGGVQRLDVFTAGQTASNPAAITIPGSGTGTSTGAPASPYPSAVTASGLPTSGMTVKSVTLNGYDHTFPDDVDIVLVSPTGQSVILMSDVGGGGDVTGLTYTFDDAAASLMADGTTNPSGTYKPTNIGAGDNWPAPGPGGAPSAVTLATFTGDFNGTWNLYVVDDLSGDVGVLSGGWSITFVSTAPGSAVFAPLAGLFTNPGATTPYAGGLASTLYASPGGTSGYVITNPSCPGVFSTITVVVNPATAITAQPANSPVVCAGSAVNFSVTATGAGTLTYQWQISTNGGGTWTNLTNTAPYSNVTTATMTVNPVTQAMNGQLFRCLVTGTCNVATSNNALLSVDQIDHTSVTGTATSACSPGTATISAVAANGSGNYTHTLTGPGIIGPPVVSGPNNSSVSFNVTLIPAGVNTYTLTTTDAIGCTKVSTVSVTINQTPLISFTTTPAAPNYVFTTSTGNAIVPGTTLVPGSRGDDVTAAVLLPFNYMAYGVSYPSIRVSSNGNIQFSGAGNASFTNICPLPSTTNLGAPFFMPHWDDLRTDINPGDGIFTSVSGTAPNRIFNIEWRGTYFGFAGTVNFEARLYEGQQRVDFIYGTVTNTGSSASIGVQGAATPTTLFTSFSCNTASTSSGLGVSFVIPPVEICIGSTVRIDASSLPTAGQTFTSLTNTHIPAGGTTTGIASPYPNGLAVSGLAASGVSVKSVTITNYSHTFPDDVDLVLVSPTGQAVILMSDCGGGTDATGQTFTFDDAAVANLSDGAFNATGTYMCTNFGAGDNWPAPGPGGAPTATTLATFTGNMNGTWNLYAFDDVSGDIGIISTWNIVFNVPQPVVFSPTTNLFTDAAATIGYTGSPAYTVWAKPTATTTYTMSNTTGGCTGTGIVTIQVNTPPAITVQPAAPATPVCPGFNINISVTATGTGLTYQWQRSTDGGTTWVNLNNDATHSGVNTATVTVINPGVAQNGHRYRVIVSGVCPPAVTSSSTTIVIATPPTISTQPVNFPGCVGGNATFSVVAGGTPAPTILQWQQSTDGGVTWTNLSTGTSLTLFNLTLSMNNYRYRVVVMNTCGQFVNSNAVVLTVSALTTVAITPVTQRICLSDTLVPLVATPAGGTWSGIGVSGFNFVPSVTAVGTYTLTYTYVNPAGCTSTGTTSVKVEDCPERLRELDDNGVILFPNPNTGRFNIRINSDLYNYLGMKVYTTDGRLVKTQVFGGLVYGRVVPIDLSNLPAAAYMVKFFFDNGNRTNEKTFTVVVQRN